MVQRLGLFVAGILLLAGSTASAANLFEDPSFEEPKDRDRWGLVFSKWGGNIYDPPARFEASSMAHGGKLSCMMVGDARSKIRVYSNEQYADKTAKKNQPAGRYRVSCFVRGMDMTGGAYGATMDFSMGFDGKFFPLKKAGSFGWTPISYVFQYDGKNPMRLFVGLWGGGRLWVDDCMLEQVDDGIALTPEPVVGAEEAPFPVAKVEGAAARCAECQWLVAAGQANCPACGAKIANGAAGADKPAVKVIADFESGKAPFSSSTITTENAAQGKQALLIDPAKDKYATIQGKQDCSGYDYFRFEAFNPSDDPAAITLEIQDEATRDYWTRVNQAGLVPPGKSTVSFRTDMYVGEKARPGRAMLKDRITRMIIANNSKTPITIDNIRLEKIDSAAAKVDGLIAIDFGPIDSPVMEGFYQGTTALMYAPGRGYGFEKATFWRAFNHYQPDALFQDCINPTAGAFRADLPNGKYHVWMNIDSPGGYWGEPQVYRSRVVKANGTPVVDEKFDFDSHIKRYFQNAAREDLPGVDPFAEYLGKIMQPKEFDVDVTDGTLRIEFKGNNWENCLSALVIYPAAKAAEGQKFLAWVNERRKVQFNEYFKQVEPRRSAAPAAGYALFTRAAQLPVNAYDGPKDGEAIPAAGLSLTVAVGEEAPLTFAVQPSADLGQIDLAISAFKNEKGADLAADTFRPGWLDYRLSRVQMDGSVYTVAPRYWQPTPARSSPGVTRRFWIRTRPADDAASGTYHGTITIKPANDKIREIPVSIRVLPFKLDPITDLAIGPWGSSISCGWEGSDPKTQEWNWAMYEKCLDAMKEAGATTITGRPSIKVTAKGGQITLDTTQADKEMKALRDRGFTQMISSYGAGGLGYNMYNIAVSEAAIKSAGFADAASYLKALYTAIEKHSEEANWVPIAWNLCDEPLGADIPPTVANAKLHREAGKGLKRQTFMGATSMTLSDADKGDITKNPHYELVKALPMPSLNLHDEPALKVIQEAGNGFSFYNGGNRWTYGRYAKFLVVKHNLKYRVSWHYNIAAADPYYALDAREDDYCWYHSDASGRMIPTVSFLAEIQQGLNDYRYLSTLQRLAGEKVNTPAGAAAKKLLDEQLNLVASTDRNPAADRAASIKRMEQDRAAVSAAIVELMK